jgi:hypothetical protein
MEKHRRALTPEQPGKAYLATGGGEQVFATDHQVHTVTDVVHHHRELVSPVLQAISEQKVAALPLRLLARGAEVRVQKRLGSGLYQQTQPVSRARPESPLAAAARVASLLVERVPALGRDVLP